MHDQREKRSCKGADMHGAKYKQALILTLILTLTTVKPVNTL